MRWLNKWLVVVRSKKVTTLKSKLLAFSWIILVCHLGMHVTPPKANRNCSVSNLPRGWSRLDSKHFLDKQIMTSQHPLFNIYCFPRMWYLGERWTVARDSMYVLILNEGANQRTPESSKPRRVGHMFSISEALTVDTMFSGVIGGFVLMIKLRETSSPLYPFLPQSWNTEVKNGFLQW